MNRHLSSTFVAAVIILLAITSAASAATSYRSGDQFTIKRSDLRSEGSGYVESIDMLFEAGQRGAFSLGTSLGTVNVRTWSENKIRLVVNKRTDAGDATTARRIFDMFRIQALRGEGDLTLTAAAGTAECARAVGVTFTVWVPKSFDVKIKTESGDIGIPKMKGRFSAHTSDGKISVDCDTRDLDVEVEDHTGDGSVVEPADAGKPDEPVEPETGGDEDKPAEAPTPSRGNDHLER